MKEEKDNEKLFFIAVIILTLLFSLFIGLTIYNEKPAKCRKTDSCNSIFR